MRGDKYEVGDRIRVKLEKGFLVGKIFCVYPNGDISFSLTERFDDGHMDLRFGQVCTCSSDDSRVSRDTKYFDVGL